MGVWPLTEGGDFPCAFFCFLHRWLRCPEGAAALDAQRAMWSEVVMSENEELLQEEHFPLPVEKKCRRDCLASAPCDHRSLRRKLGDADASADGP